MQVHPFFPENYSQGFPHIHIKSPWHFARSRKPPTQERLKCAFRRGSTSNRASYYGVCLGLPFFLFDYLRVCPSICFPVSCPCFGLMLSSGSLVTPGSRVESTSSPCVTFADALSQTSKGGSSISIQSETLEETVSSTWNWKHMLCPSVACVE